MISDNFTNLSSNPTITEIGCALNNSFDGVHAFILLIALVFVIGFGIYSWQKTDPFGSFIYALSIVTTLAFFLTLAGADNCLRLITYPQFTFFLVLTALGFVFKRMID